MQEVLNIILACGQEVDLGTEGHHRPREGPVKAPFKGCLAIWMQNVLRDPQETEALAGFSPPNGIHPCLHQQSTSALPHTPNGPFGYAICGFPVGGCRYLLANEDP